MAALEDLLAHERWALRLARALLRDDAAAEDVVQEARVAFWRQGPHEPDRARSWFGTVIRNLVRNHVRGERRADARAEASGAIVVSETTTAESLALRLETQRLLAGLVMDLREPSREVVLLRYYEDLTSAEIARKLGVPAGTVRRRLKSGLDELRSRLDEKHGGKRRDWMIALTPFAQVEAIPDQRPASAPGWRVPALSLGLLALVAVTATVWRSKGTAGITKTAGINVEARRDAELPARARANLPVLPVKLAPGAVRETTQSHLPAWTMTEGLPSRAIGGRVMSGGAPVTGATLRLTSGMFPFVPVLEKHAQTDAQGRFAFAAVEPTNWLLTVHAPHLAPEILYVDLRGASGAFIFPRQPAGRDDVGALSIELESCQRTVRGAVRDEGGGFIAGATVTFVSRAGVGGVSVPTGQRGEYALCVPSRPYLWQGDNGKAWNQKTLMASADGYGRIETEIAGVEWVSHDFVLQPQIVVSGRVIREDNGAGIPGARISIEPPWALLLKRKAKSWPVQAQAISNADGRFEMAGIAPGLYLVQAMHDDHFGWNFKGQVRLTAGDTARVLDDVKLSPSGIVEGWVRRNGEGIPSAQIAFSARPDLKRPNYDRDYTTSASTIAGGRFKARIKLNTTINQIVAHVKIDGDTKHVEVLSPTTLVIDKPHVTGVVIDLAPTDVPERDTY